MKAIICVKYGAPEVLEIREIEKPIPKDNEVLIKIHATSVHIGDTKVRSLEPGMGKIKDLFIKPMMRIMLGFFGPRNKILGMEMAGEIESIGKNVTKFNVGDKVFGSTEIRFGTYAEYCCVSEDGVITSLPSNITYEQAAPIANGALTALLFLRKANVKKNQKILIYGASGSVGTFAVQLAKNFGLEVTGVCSTTNIEMVESLGADNVIDYKKEDFTENGKTYDIIFDAVAKISKEKRKISLKESGIYLNVLELSGSVKLKVADLNFIKELCEEGVLKAVIDRTYAFEDIVEAHKYVDKGRKKGNVVVKIL